jgi:hypothetical protein
MSDRLEAVSERPDHDVVMRILDEVLEFLQGGLRALQGAATEGPDATSSERVQAIGANGPANTQTRANAD